VIFFEWKQISAGFFNHLFISILQLQEGRVVILLNGLTPQHF